MEILNPTDSLFYIWSVWSYKKEVKNMISIGGLFVFTHFSGASDKFLHVFASRWADLPWPDRFTVSDNQIAHLEARPAWGWEDEKSTLARSVSLSCPQILLRWRREEAGRILASPPEAAGSGKPLQGGRHGGGMSDCVVFCVCLRFCVRSPSGWVCSERPSWL